jgi:hypothetical protein
MIRDDTDTSHYHVVTSFVALLLPPNDEITSTLKFDDTIRSKELLRLLLLQCCCN